MSIHPNPELGFYMLAGQPESPENSSQNCMMLKPSA